MFRVVKELLLMQWRTFSREPGVLFWSLAFPIILTGLLGMAFKKKGDQPLPVAFVAESPAETQSLLTFQASLKPGALLSYSTQSEADARLSLKRGRAVMAVFKAWDPQARRFLMDPANSEGELALRRCKAWFAWRRTSASSTVVSWRPRIRIRPSTIVVCTALPSAANTRCE